MTSGQQQQRRREAYAKNRDRELVQNREWRAKNKQRRAAYMKPYLAEYYRKNRKQIREQMANKYESDPAYRKQVLADSKTRDAKVKAGHVPKPPQIRCTTDGTTERLYRQSEGARVIGCCRTAFNRWHREGWIPEPTKQLGRRLYTREQLDLIGLFYSINCHHFMARTEASKFIFDTSEKLDEPNPH